MEKRGQLCEASAQDLLAEVIRGLIERVKARSDKFREEEIEDVLRALENLEEKELEEFYAQFAGLANKVMIVDVMDLTELSSIKKAVKKVYGYLEIGLNFCSEGNLERALEIFRGHWRGISGRSLKEKYQLDWINMLRAESIVR